ncbi:hypothetical protein ABZ759_29535 [Streptomyces sp. NPDC047860]|uniref:hypothetical protein n=1 Tax=Streptomyces sp. NPDC047860 TaxID=3155743 RepID=UPI003407A611
MTSSTWDRSRRIASAARVLTVIAVVVGVLVLAVGVSVPETWWPHAGQAFAADSHPTQQDPCIHIVGPAKDYCERGAVITASAGQPDIARAAWRLVLAAAGVASLVLWRLLAAGQGRR